MNKLAKGDTIDEKLTSMRQYIGRVDSIEHTCGKMDGKLEHFSQLEHAIQLLSKRAEENLKKISYIEGFDLKNGDLRKMVHELKDKVEAMNNLEFKFDFMEGFEEQSKGIEQRLNYLESLDLKIKGVESMLDVFRQRLDKMSGLELRADEICHRFDHFEHLFAKTASIEHKMGAIDEVEMKLSLIESKVYKLDELEMKLDNCTGHIGKLDSLETKLGEMGCLEVKAGSTRQVEGSKRYSLTVERGGQKLGMIGSERGIGPQGMGGSGTGYHSIEESGFAKGDSTRD